LTSYSLIVKIIAEKPFTREVEGFLTLLRQRDRMTGCGQDGTLDDVSERRKRS